MEHSDKTQKDRSKKQSNRKNKTGFAEHSPGSLFNSNLLRHKHFGNRALQRHFRGKKFEQNRILTNVMKRITSLRLRTTGEATQSSISASFQGLILPMTNLIDRAFNRVENGQKIVEEKRSSESGRPLPESLGRKFQPFLGFDQSHVRIHTHDETGRQVKKAGADAITIGRDIYFSPGKFAPDNPRGRALLVHELTHVRQQSGMTGHIDSKAKSMQQFEREALANESIAYKQFSGISSESGFNFSSSAPGFLKAPMSGRQPGYKNTIKPVKSAAGNDAVPMAALSNRRLNENLVDINPAEQISKEDELDTLALTEAIYKSLKMKLKIEKERMGG
jgi:hypothetical protein